MVVQLFVSWRWVKRRHLLPLWTLGVGTLQKMVYPQDLVECLIGTGVPFGKRIYSNYYKELEKISRLTAGVRRLGAAALDLAYVSSGKIDGFWEKDLNLWDVSAGVLLVKEAGGRVTEPQGDNWTTKSKDILVSNTLIHEKLSENLTLL